MKATLRRGFALILAICLVAALGICASAKEYYHSDFYGGSGYGAAGSCTAHEAWISMGTSSNYTVEAKGYYRYETYNPYTVYRGDLHAPLSQKSTKDTAYIGPVSMMLYMEATHSINGVEVYSSGRVYPD